MSNPYQGYPQGQQIIIQSPPSNGLGTAGFIISLIGFVFTGGILCPLGLILSFFALFKPPRGLAIAGFIIGLIGTAIDLIAFLFFGAVILSCLGLGMSVAAMETKTQAALSDADQRVQQYYLDNRTLPSDLDGNALIDSLRDGYGHRLRYYQDPPSSYQIHSAGPDGRFGTADDRIKTNSISSATTPRMTSPPPSRPATPVEPE
jgi:type II secretory pathway pseudopilin PulG